MPRNPLILVPGVCGSKLYRENRVSGKRECVWIHFGIKKLQPSWSSKVVEGLWGKPSAEEQGWIKSFCEDYYHIGVDKNNYGIDGLSRLIDLKLMDLPIFRRIKFAAYFGPLIDHLTENHGYELGVDLHGFPYDWTQPLHHPNIMTAFHQLIQDAQAKCEGRKVDLIGHSMGGLVIDTYQRLYPDWATRIRRVTALGVPYHGAGAYCTQATIVGYNLRLPAVPQCVVHQIQAQGGSTSYLCPSPFKRGPQACIFIRRAHGETVTVREQPTASTGSPAPSTPAPGTPLFPASPMALRPDSVEMGAPRAPSVAEVLYDTVLTRPDLVTEDRDRVLAMLHSCTPASTPATPSTYTERLQKLTGPKELLTVLEKPFDLNRPTAEEYADTGSWHWEQYAIGVHTDSEPFQEVVGDAGAPFEVPRDPRIRRTVDGVVEVSDECPLKEEIREGFTSDLSQRNSGVDIRDVLLLRSIYCEMTGIEPYQRPKTSESLQSRVRSFIDRLGTPSEAPPRLAPGPWSDQSVRTATPTYNMLDLFSNLTRPGTFEHFLYAPSMPLWRDCWSLRSREIVWPGPDVDFSFLNLFGIGTPTPFHAVFAKPVQEDEELCYQMPVYINDDGDSTVVAHSAMDDGVPDHLVWDRIGLCKREHFPMLFDKEVWAHLEEFLGLPPLALADSTDQ
eukprot:gnl/Dysnectes_brevis/3226_a4034_815.p1 GENE.gnl/Dysnectes_brevis/3226_a4034_815~~gnl/Dysnectes_brevis/3226_a4034_815.p1  ORF type:complete len:673 (+),score=197.49 gnl/Dysnectes_brevis/3226_a4034_815:40-2058(+)